jgi:hypothetical protein
LIRVTFLLLFFRFVIEISVRLLKSGVFMRFILDEFDNLGEIEGDGLLLLIKIADSWRKLSLFSLLWENLSPLVGSSGRTLTHRLFIVRIFDVILQLCLIGSLHLDVEYIFHIASIDHGGWRSGAVKFFRGMIIVLLTTPDFDIVFVSEELPMTLFVEKS